MTGWASPKFGSHPQSFPLRRSEAGAGFSSQVVMPKFPSFLAVHIKSLAPQSIRPTCRSSFFILTAQHVDSLFQEPMARLAAVCILAAAACCLLRSLAFVPAPATRSDALATATGAAVIATIPAGADAFVYKGALGSMLSRAREACWQVLCTWPKGSKR